MRADGRSHPARRYTGPISLVKGSTRVNSPADNTPGPLYSDLSVPRPLIFDAPRPAPLARYRVCLPGRSHALKSVTRLGRAMGAFEKALATKPLTQERHRP